MLSAMGDLGWKWVYIRGRGGGRGKDRVISVIGSSVDRKTKGLPRMGAILVVGKRQDLNQFLIVICMNVPGFGETEAPSPSAGIAPRMNGGRVTI